MMRPLTTSIDMLPDLEELEGPRPLAGGVIGSSMHSSKYLGSGILPPSEVEKYSKFIRGNHQLHPESGMASYVNNNEQTGGTPPPMTPPNQEYAVPKRENNNEGIHIGSNPKYSLPEGLPSCIDCANHIASCPLCTQIYNNDKTIYIIAIVVLSIICILLLKRVLNV
jgi:hypothetical protein